MHYRYVVLRWSRGRDILLHQRRKEVLERIALRYNRDFVDEIVEKAELNCDFLIGVHIRHGDFGSLFVPMSDYAQAMCEVTISTSQRICSGLLRRTARQGRVSRASSTSRADDLTLLSRCDSVIRLPLHLRRLGIFRGSFRSRAECRDKYSHCQRILGQVTDEFSDCHLAAFQNPPVDRCIRFRHRLSPE